MSMYIGALAYQQGIQRRNLEMVQRERTTIEASKKEADMWAEMSFDVTTGMIDKRYKESKTFIQSGGRVGEIRFKSSLSEHERQLAYLTRQNMMRSRSRYENTVSRYNQKMTDRKLRSSMKKIDLRPFL